MPNSVVDYASLLGWRTAGAVKYGNKLRRGPQRVEKYGTWNKYCMDSLKTLWFGTLFGASFPGPLLFFVVICND